MSIRALLCSLEAMALGTTPRASLAVGEVRLLEQALADAVSANEELDDLSVYALYPFDGASLALLSRVLRHLAKCHAMSLVRVVL